MIPSGHTGLHSPARPLAGMRAPLACAALAGISLWLGGCSQMIGGGDRGVQVYFQPDNADAGQALWEREEKIKELLLAGGQLEDAHASGFWMLSGTKGGPFEDLRICLVDFPKGMGINVLGPYRMTYSPEMRRMESRIASAIGPDLMKHFQVSSINGEIFPILGDGAGG
jgi:hypothetical protein